MRTLGAPTTSSRNPAPEFVLRVLSARICLLDPSRIPTFGNRHRRINFWGYWVVDVCDLIHFRSRSLLLTVDIFPSLQPFGSGFVFPFLCHFHQHAARHVPSPAPKTPRVSPIDRHSADIHPAIPTTFSTETGMDNAGLREMDGWTAKWGGSISAFRFPLFLSDGLRICCAFQPHISPRGRDGTKILVFFSQPCAACCAARPVIRDK